MASSGPISIEDETGVVQLAGTATFPDGIAADGVATPDVATGNSDPITIKTGDTADSAGDAGDITIEGGDGGSGSGHGGSVTIHGGGGDSQGTVKLTDFTGAVVGVEVQGNGAVQIAPANANVAISPTSAGSVDINPGGTLSLGDGYLQLTVAAAVPTTYTTPLHYDSTAVTGGLYAWDGAAYQKVGPPA